MRLWHKRTHRIRRTGSQGFFSLDELQPGEQARVIDLHGGHGLLSRMAAMGFTPGVEVSLIQNSGSGPLIACVRGARIALGRFEARKIRVSLMNLNES